MFLFSEMSRRGLGPIQLPIQWAPGFCPRGKLTIRLYLVLRLRMSWAVRLFQVYVFMAWTRKTLSFWRVMVPEREADHSPSSVTEIKSASSPCLPSCCCFKAQKFPCTFCGKYQDGDGSGLCIFWWSHLQKAYDSVLPTLIIWEGSKLFAL